MADGNGGQLETRELGPGSSLVDLSLVQPNVLVW